MVILSKNLMECVTSEVRFFTSPLFKQKTNSHFGVIPARDAGIQKKRNMDPSVSYLDDRKLYNESVVFSGIQPSGVTTFRTEGFRGIIKSRNTRNSDGLVTIKGICRASQPQGLRLLFLLTRTLILS
ncbi:hypothetical protein TNCT_401731 [Trichonephila clavata]|uniref:Uncharacterized protein n=1 Tax=Trichonephila clavata TaxID=2740835 RepID=A0A8X6HLJ2_TRICU|nr:hypothetical protein TNCT_401731 [Trichonephila clavata]